MGVNWVDLMAMDHLDAWVLYLGVNWVDLMAMDHLDPWVPNFGVTWVLAMVLTWWPWTTQKPQSPPWGSQTPGSPVLGSTGSLLWGWPDGHGPPGCLGPQFWGQLG